MTGGMGGFLGSPLFLVKARLQNAGNVAGRYSYNYRGLGDGLRQVPFGTVFHYESPPCEEMCITRTCVDYDDTCGCTCDDIRKVF